MDPRISPCEILKLSEHCINFAHLLLFIVELQPLRAVRLTELFRQLREIRISLFEENFDSQAVERAWSSIKRLERLCQRTANLSDSALFENPNSRQAYLTSSEKLLLNQWLFP